MNFKQNPRADNFCLKSISNCFQNFSQENHLDARFHCEAKTLRKSNQSLSFARNLKPSFSDTRYL